MDILDLLKKYGLEVAEEKQSDFNSDFRKSFKSGAELKKYKDEVEVLRKELETANKTIEDNKLASAKGSENEETLKKEIEGYKAQIAEISFNALLEKGLKGIEFANERVKNSVISEIKGKGFTEKDGELVGLSDYLKDLYKNEPTTFKEVDAGIHTWGSSQTQNTETATSKYSNLFGTII